MTATPSAFPLPTASRASYAVMAAAASAIHMLMMIPGYSEDGDFAPGPYFSMFAVSLAVSLLVFLFAVPVGGATAALVVAVLALVSIVVFWAGVTLPLAAAAAVIAQRNRVVGERRKMATAALGTAVLTTVALVAIIVGDALGN